MSRHNLFFAPEQETDDFRGVLQRVQEHIAGQHSELLSDGNAAEAKAHIKRYIAKFVQDSRVAVRGMMPRNIVTKDSLKRLHIYADANYEQQAQKPVALDVE